MSSIRVWHAYVGVLIAPSVLFFALTGCLQLFGLHEANGTYHPAPIIEKLGKLHKDQVFALSEHHQQDAPKSDADAGKDAQEKHEDADDDKWSIATALLKVFFLVVGLGLITSTTLGLWMGLTQLRYKRLARILLLVGIVLPVALVVL
jgi:uncharacterized iron-regulated membrane protein